jgi:hypothetical protein
MPCNVVLGEGVGGGEALTARRTFEVRSDQPAGLKFRHFCVEFGLDFLLQGVCSVLGRVCAEFVFDFLL